MTTDKWVKIITDHLFRMQYSMNREVYYGAMEELLRLQSQRLNSHNYGLVHRYAWPTGKEITC